MKTIYKIVAIINLCWCGVPGTAHAQTSFSIGPRVGLNVASASYNHNDASPYAFSTGAVTRLESGIMASIDCGHFSLQPAVLYAQRGFVLKGTLQPAASSSFRPSNAQLTRYLDYLTLPVNFVYSQKSNGEGFQGFGGGYLGVLLGGRRVVHDQYNDAGGGTSFYDSEQPIKPGKESLNADEYYSQRLDAGLQVGLGYRYRAAGVQLTYSMGLTNLEVSYPTLPRAQTPTYYNRALQIAFVYLFKIKKESKQ